MYIKSIKIDNYRNFSSFEMEFHDGLNVIIGSNNSGKTGLLKAIHLISNPDDISIEDFNKNDLQLYYREKYEKEPPEITIQYEIYHRISEENTADESIVKLLPFLNINKIEECKISEKGTTKKEYDIIACINMKYRLDPKYMEQYTNKVKDINNFEEYYNVLRLFERNYSWIFTNGSTDTLVEKKFITNIFNIELIEAERKSEEVYCETKKEIKQFLNDEENICRFEEIKQKISSEIKRTIQTVLDRIETVISDEKNDIGLKNGNVAISQELCPSLSVADSYVINVRDTKSDFVLPLSHNGLGYNNLINMYMLIKLVDIQRGKDFKILCIEEPEAHLHPAMQYKLFKFLKKIDEEDALNQQIFVTTHSSNITAVAGIDNMFMLSYERGTPISLCKQQSLEKQFSDSEDAKKHMMKFLDVTRSDMLFADKVILVEGIAEKLLLPKFMEKCNFAYEDEHVAIVEIGGKHFEYFIKMFAKNPVNKQVLCITDKDFKWDREDGIPSVEEYNSHNPAHIEDLRKKFSDINNLKIVTQNKGGRTFEDELFISNISSNEVSCEMLKIACSSNLSVFIDNNEINFDKWLKNIESIDGRSRDKIKKKLSLYKNAIENYPLKKVFYQELFFGELFLEYAEEKKGEVALNILVNEDIDKNMIVPEYIKEGIKWLKQ